jgi:CRP-like cAMP-binding protein
VDHSTNRLLASLPADLLGSLSPHLKHTKLTFEDVLAEAGSTIQRVYFPHAGVISLVVGLSIGDMIETAMVGRDGVYNAACALDGKLSLNKGIVQLAGEASVIDADQLRTIANGSPVFRSVLIRHEQVLFAQAQQSAACNASHSVESRMCRWLLRMRDLAGDDLTLTHEFLSQMLGVRRTSVSLIANTLQKAGYIRYRRGHIRLIDIAGLEESACECYGTVKAHYDRLLALGKS